MSKLEKRITGGTPPPCTWLLYGSYFRLPLTVKWGSYQYDYCQVTLHETLPLLRVQRAAGEQVLSRTAIGQDGNGWSFHVDGLTQLAVPIRGDPDPETLLRWNPEELIYQLPPGDDWSGMADNGSSNSARIAQAVRKFLNAFVDRVGLAGFADFGELEGFYYILCNFMMRYLQGGTDGVELVFCRLFPTPCKPQWIAWRKRPRELLNWHKKKKINLWMTKRAAREMGTQPIGKGRAWMKERRKLGWRWRIGLTHNPRWRKTERETQTKLFEVLGEYGYAKTNYERSAQVWDHLAKLLQEWLEAHAEPALSDALARFQNVTIRPIAGEVRRGRPRSRGANNARYKGPRKTPPSRQPDQPAAVGKTDAAVPAVPNLRPEPPNLRDAGGND